MIYLLLLLIFVLVYLLRSQKTPELFENIKIYNSNIPIGPTRHHNHPPKYMGTNQEPWFTRESIIFLHDYIQKNKNKKLKVLEFGSGSSTAWFLKNGCDVTSVEHIKKWLDEISLKIPEELKKNWIPQHIEIKNFDKGFNDNNYDAFNYTNFPLKSEQMYDIICIDGRHRVKCLINSIDKLNKNGLLVLDNAERHYYQKGIDSVPKNWLRNDFKTPVDTTIIWKHIN